MATVSQRSLSGIPVTFQGRENAPDSTAKLVKGTELSDGCQKPEILWETCGGPSSLASRHLWSNGKDHPTRPQSVGSADNCVQSFQQNAANSGDGEDSDFNLTNSNYCLEPAAGLAHDPGSSSLSHKRKAESDLQLQTVTVISHCTRERPSRSSAVIARSRRMGSKGVVLATQTQPRRQIHYGRRENDSKPNAIKGETWTTTDSEHRRPSALDQGAFPHILAAIISSADYSTLLTLRGASSDVCDLVTPRLLKHLTVSDGMLRSYAGCIWVPDEDTRIAQAEYIDLAKDTEGQVCLPLCINAAHLVGLRLIRLFSKDSPSFYNPTNILTYSRSVKWIVEFVDLVKDSWTGSVTNSTTANVVYNLDIGGQVPELAAKEVDLFTVSPATPTYILFTCYGQPLSIDLVRREVGEGPSTRPRRVRLLNTLLESLVLVWQKWLTVVPLQSLPAAKLVFVGTDSWDPEWLASTFCNFLTFRFRVVTETTNIVEPLRLNATLEERMTWWLEALAEAAGYDDHHKHKLFDSVDFMSLDEFRREVDDSTMFSMIMDKRFAQNKCEGA